MGEKGGREGSEREGGSEKEGVGKRGEIEPRHIQR